MSRAAGAPDSVTIHAPSTIGNFGPGFDVLGLALAARGDRITLEVADSDAIIISGPRADTIPTAWDANCASRALDALREQHHDKRAYKLTIAKGVRPGSGLGSSASSSAGAALAFHALHADEYATTPEALIEAAAHGEGRVAGWHRDDVACVILGGLTAVRTEADGTLAVARFDPPRDLHLAIALPDVVLETKRMRAVLPASVPRADGIANIASVAHLLHAFTTNDIPRLGAALDDRIALPARAPLVPGYEDARAAALAAGAHGACLSGSGPATFAVCETAATAKRAADAMLEAITALGLAGESFTSAPYRTIPYDDVQVS